MNPIHSATRGLATMIRVKRLRVQDESGANGERVKAAGEKACKDRTRSKGQAK